MNKVLVKMGSSNSLDHLFMKPSTPLALLTIVGIWSENFSLGSRRTPRCYSGNSDSLKSNLEDQQGNLKDQVSLLGGNDKHSQMLY